MSLSKTDLIFELYRLGRRIRSQVQKHNEDKMLVASILRELQRGACTVSAMAEYLYCTLSSISEKLRDMESTGLISKSTDTDMRERKVSLTEKGKGMIKEIEVKMKDHCVQLFNALADDELATLVKLMAKINLNIEKIEDRS